jgi:putative protease
MARRTPEVLAPAGDRACLEAAIGAGADAVYFGLKSFNARARATNFDAGELDAAMALLHAHGRKGYVVLNTLVFDSELAELEVAIRGCAEAGVDAVIVQDLGVVRLVRALTAELPIHASTQMTCTDAGAVRLARSLGADRVMPSSKSSCTGRSASRTRASASPAKPSAAAARTAARARKPAASPTSCSWTASAASSAIARTCSRPRTSTRARSSPI